MVEKGSYRGVSVMAVSVFAHLLVVAILSLILVWIFHFKDGVAFYRSPDDTYKIYYLHVLLATLFTLISGEAIVAYKILPPTRIRKFIHLILHFLALASGVLAIYVAFRFHHVIHLPHLYSFHSWLGLSAVCLFGSQWVLGFFSFWYPGAELSARARLAPWHVFFGVIIFFMLIICCITGLVQTFDFFQLIRGQEALVINFTTLLVFLFAVTVGFSVILPHHQYRY